jgi:uncharacterized protein YcaQ
MWLAAPRGVDARARTVSTSGDDTTFGPVASRPVKFPAETARRFLVARHLLAPARSLEGGPEAVMEVFRRLGSIQLDPVAVAGLSHDLVLHARVSGYEPAWCDELFERRELVEAYNKGLSLVPAGEFAWFRVRNRRRARNVLDDNAQVAERVLERIRTEGALSSLDFERETGPTKDWFGAPMNSVRAVLEAYALTGELVTARRDGSHRYFDLPERLLPAELLAHDPPLSEQLRHKMLSQYRAHGLLGPTAHGEGYFADLGPANPDPRYPEYPGRNALRDGLVEQGELLPVDVEGVSGKRFVVRDDVELLQAPPEPPPSVAFLSPYDALVWDRRLLGSLFGFEYVWELYVPPDKRRWGWYVLPILFRDRFVGRIEPRIDRDEAAVQVLGLWWEDGFEPQRAEGFVDAMREALDAYLRFAGAGRVEWPPHLGAERRLFPGA